MSKPQVILQTTYGNITFELDAENAPISTENFLSYVDQGFYNETIFHRVIDGFMVQGGGFTVDMQQKENGKSIKNEAANGLKNDKGSIAMARTNEPHSATAQFFINVSDNDFLNHTAPSGQGWGYAVFGKVVDGMDVVDKITACKTGSAGHHKDVPVNAIIINSAERV